MTKKQIYHIIEWIVALAACGYLIYRLAIYDDYPALWATLRGMEMSHIGALLLCVALMPVNMSLEAWRWRTLINGDASLNGANGAMMNWREVHRQVYYSKLAGLITPWRLGEYPSRAILMAQEMENGKWTMDNVWSRGLSMGAVGAATMTIAIIATGMIAMIMDNGQWTMDNYYLLVGGVLLLLILVLYFAPRLLRRWATVSHRLVLISTAQSFVRLACWCVQLALVLWALGGDEISLSGDHVITKSFIYYLLVTITPNVPIAEVGVRGAWAIWVFGSMNAALAGVLLWVINTLLPCLIWPFLRKKE